MIVFDLRCEAGHVFETWFQSSAAYDEQQARGLVTCPMCGTTGVSKAVMAPNVGAKGNRASAAAAPDAAALWRALAAAQADALKSSRWVGRDFATEARAMQAGERPDTPIHGQADATEVKALVEEGVPIAPLIIPVTPPEQLN